MPPEKLMKLQQVCREVGVAEPVVMDFIQRHWVILENVVENEAQAEMDEQDYARVRLILELQRDFGVNDEGIEIILHLLDQLYAIRGEVQRRTA